MRCSPSARSRRRAETAQRIAPSARGVAVRARGTGAIRDGRTRRGQRGKRTRLILRSASAQDSSGRTGAHDARVHGRASASAADSCALALDDPRSTRRGRADARFPRAVAGVYARAAGARAVRPRRAPRRRCWRRSVSGQKGPRGDNRRLFSFARWLRRRCRRRTTAGAAARRRLTRTEAQLPRLVRTPVVAECVLTLRGRGSRRAFRSLSPFDIRWIAGACQRRAGGLPRTRGRP